LLVVPEGVNGPERPGLVVGQLETRKLTGLVDPRLKPDAAAGCLVEDFGSALEERGLEEHLERVLKVEEHDGRSAVVVRAIESGHRGSHGGQRLTVQRL